MKMVALVILPVIWGSFALVGGTFPDVSYTDGGIAFTPEILSAVKSLSFNFVELLYSEGEDNEPVVMQILYEMERDKASLHVDMSAFPVEDNFLGPEPVHLLSGVRRAEYEIQWRRIGEKFQNDMGFSINYVAKDKSYAILRSLNNKCVWIAWKNQQIQSGGWTPELTNLLSANGFQVDNSGSKVKLVRVEDNTVVDSK